jgi:hypothetical protein
MTDVVFYAKYRNIDGVTRLSYERDVCRQAQNVVICTFCVHFRERRMHNSNQITAGLNGDFYFAVVLSMFEFTKVENDKRRGSTTITSLIRARTRLLSLKCA